MYYFRYQYNNTKIEFINSISGKETIMVNGQVVSQKTTIMGTAHRFSLIESGEKARYILRTKIGGETMVLIDLSRNGHYILQNEPVHYGTPDKQEMKRLSDGLKKLKTFDLDGALLIFDEVLEDDPNNAQIHFYKACAHSLMEHKKEAFKHLSHALENGLVDREQILTEDALAFIRIQEEFEAFCSANGIETPEY